MVLVYIDMVGITVGAAWPADDRHEKVLYDVILNLLRIRDEHQMDRIRVAFEEPSVGILPMIKDALVEVRSSALKAWYCRPGHVRNNSSADTIAYRAGRVWGRICTVLVLVMCGAVLSWYCIVTKILWESWAVGGCLKALKAEAETILLKYAIV